MKATVGRWTMIQNHLPDTAEGNDLWSLIERRTFGKYFYNSVSIKLAKPQQQVVDVAIEELTDDEKRAYPK